MTHDKIIEMPGDIRYLRTFSCSSWYVCHQNGAGGHRTEIHGAGSLLRLAEQVSQRRDEREDAINDVVERIDNALKDIDIHYDIYGRSKTLLQHL